MDICLKNVKKDYEAIGEGREAVHVLKDINLTIQQGDYLSVIGRSGCGKTTLLKLIGLLDVPTGGELYIDGKEQSNLWKDELADIRRRSMGFVFQDYFLLEDLSAFDNIRLPGLLEKKEAEQTKQRAFELAEYLKIDKKLLKKYPHELSGGEKQRIAIARALFNDPEMILADEPTGNLDDNTRKTVEAIFDRLNRSMNKTILLVTHDLEFAEKSKDRYRIREGVLQKEK